MGEVQVCGDPVMYLGRVQEDMLKGKYGWATAKALEVIVKVGESLGADRLVPIKHAHVSGISYTNIGEPGLLFIKRFYEEGGRVRVYTTTNPGCIDLTGRSRIISEEPRMKQFEIYKALESMGFKPTYTCIPYLHRIPGRDEHLAWGESNAVIIANSFYGARTNREGGPLALAAALTGYTYYAGLHKLENRTARVVIDVKYTVNDETAGATGLWIGYNIDDVPMINNPPRSLYDLKLMLAASAASGSHGLVVLKGVTPERTYLVDESAEKISLEKHDIERYLPVETTSSEKVLGYIGCPHLHPGELLLLAKLLEKYEKPRRDNVLLVSIPAIYQEIFPETINYLRLKGVDVAIGTCPIVSRLKDGFDVVVTNSGKAYFYLSRLHGLKTRLSGLKKILEAVYS